MVTGDTLVRSEGSPTGLDTAIGLPGGGVHLIGVAGTGLRGMAGILRECGHRVSGSEAVECAALRQLEAKGVSCFVGHREENLPPGTDVVVVSAAIPAENPEVREARRLGIRVVKYAEFLGQLMSSRAGIAVSGTHGKTTTTAMVAQVLRAAGEAPGFLVGGDYPTIGGSACWGAGRYFVAEACEFDRSFLNLFPRYTIITNIEEDHLDYFSSLDDIQEAFGDFVSHLPPDGFLALNADDENSHALATRAPCAVGTFSLIPGEGDWWAENVHPCGRGMCFDGVTRDGRRVPVRLGVPGIHNVKNALAVFALLDHLGVPVATIARSLGEFVGVKRRFEVLLGGAVSVIDDYAHHPTEIEMVLRAARETYPDQRLRVVFQPHQYSRTYRFLHGFAEVLSEAQDVIVTDVFAARDSDEDRRRIDAGALADAVCGNGGTAIHLRGFDAIVEHARCTCADGDVFLCLGAGDITELAVRLSQALGTRMGEVA